MDQLTVKLQHPTEFDGIRRDTLTLRTPLVRDMRLASRQAPSENKLCVCRVTHRRPPGAVAVSALPRCTSG
jgi:hypothetical protein